MRAEVKFSQNDMCLSIKKRSVYISFHYGQNEKKFMKKSFDATSLFLRNIRMHRCFLLNDFFSE